MFRIYYLIPAFASFTILQAFLGASPLNSWFAFAAIYLAGRNGAKFG